MKVRPKSKPMKEILYRESRIARTLGDPAKYAIIELLVKKGPKTVTEIARVVHRADSTVSHHLARLRNLELVRYEVKKNCAYYWIKYRKEVKLILKSLKMFVRRTKYKLENDI